MSKADEYRRKLRGLKDWDGFLRKESGLPGPRGNLELAQVVAEDASLRQIEAWLSIPPQAAPENSAEVFLVFCAVAALGKRLARGELEQLPRLRGFAADQRWRVREAVAIALQYYGDADMRGLITEMRKWSTGNAYEQRAAAAALAEPRLLRNPGLALDVLGILDRITRAIEITTDRRNESFKTLRKSMGYCWSVVVAAFPKAGKTAFEKWLGNSDADVRWIVRENLRKNRLTTMDAKWVARCVSRLKS